MKKLLLAAAAIISAVTGCSLEEACESPGEEAYVRFDMKTTGTKSSLGVGETAISSVNLFAYCDSVLVDKVYITDFSEGVGMTLVSGSTYHVYALVNFDECEAPESEANLPSFRYLMSSIGDIAKAGLPMVGKTELTTGPYVNSAEIVLTRLVSKVNFKVETEGIGGLSVTSVRVMQAALNVFPFSEASAAAVVSYGDFASDKDLTAINNGMPASFYVLENCQGVLLPGNEDPWLKVPDSLPTRYSRLCTYLEVGVELDGTGGITGTATYRFYLGQDDTTDFNVIRNTSSTVTLMATLGGLEEVSWKIESDITFEELAYSLAAGDYVGQWGTISFPEATEDNPVTITFRGESMTIPSENSDYLGDPGADAPDLLVYTGSSSDEVYICLGTKSVNLTFAQGTIAESVTVNVSDNIGWAAGTDSEGLIAPGGTITVNEDGTDNEVRFYLWDVDEEEVLSPDLFSMPDEVIAVINPEREVSHKNMPLYWYFDLDLYTEDGTLADVASGTQWYPATEDEQFLYRRYVYGLAADGTDSAYTELTSSQLYLWQSTQYNIEIIPAFPDQRHLGEVYNYQFAFGDLNSNTASLPLYQTSAGTTRASWRVGRGSQWQEGDNEDDLEVVYNNPRELTLVSAKQSYSDLVFTFLAPTDAVYYPYVGGGTYHIRGTVTNPHSEREIVGDYSADIVLYLVVGAEAYVYEDDDITYMDISYMPVVSRLGETNDETYRDIWNMQCQWIGVTPASGNYSYNHTVFGTGVYTGIRVPTNVVHDVTDLDSMYSKLLEFANKELTVTYGSNFKFCNWLTGASGTVLKMETGGVIIEGHRLQDIETGVYFVEDYFGSFDDN